MRLNDFNPIDSSEAQKKWFSTFCVFLAIVQYEPSIFCLCMNRDSESITRCNKILYSATEFALWYLFFNYILFLFYLVIL